MSFMIRPAISGDARHVQPLLEALMREQGARFPRMYPQLEPHAAATEWVATWRRRLELGDPDIYTWLACDRAMVGLLAGDVWTRVAGEPPRVFFAEWFYVVPEARQKGIGLALEAELLRTCADRGLSHIEARSTFGDTQWLDRGWQPTSLQVTRELAAFATDLARAVERKRKGAA